MKKGHKDQGLEGKLDNLKGDELIQLLNPEEGIEVAGYVHQIHKYWITLSTEGTGNMKARMDSRIDYPTYYLKYFTDYKILQGSRCD